MSLSFKLPAPYDRFYLTETEDQPEYGHEKGEKYLDPNVQNCILMTMSTTIGHIKTEADAIEHYVRAKLANRGEECFPLATALSLVGLTTNVFPRETDSKFIARVGKVWLSEARWWARKAAEKAALAALEADQTPVATLDYVCSQARNAADEA